MDKFLFLNGDFLFVYILYFFIGVILFYLSMKISYKIFEIKAVSSWLLLIISFFSNLLLFMGLHIIHAFVGMLFLMDIVIPYMIIRRQKAFSEQE